MRKRKKNENQKKREKIIIKERPSTEVAAAVVNGGRGQIKKASMKVWSCKRERERERNLLELV